MFHVDGRLRRSCVRDERKRILLAGLERADRFSRSAQVDFMFGDAALTVVREVRGDWRLLIRRRGLHQNHGYSEKRLFVLDYGVERRAVSALKVCDGQYSELVASLKRLANISLANI